MSRAKTTKQSLLAEGRRLFWERGYSNVPVRDVARAAGVDVALISRYFGSKLGLFEETLKMVDPIDPRAFANPEDLVAKMVTLFVTYPRPAPDPSPVTMALMNAKDPEVGGLVRATLEARWHAPLAAILGSEHRAALFTAALMGFSVAEKSLELGGIASPGDPDYAAQLQALLSVATTWERPG